MTALPHIQYFLGANSPTGFYSLYDHLISPEEARAIYILKGGPGCGKSTLMRRVERHAQAAGLETEQVLLTTKHEQAFDLATVKEAALAMGMSLPSESQTYNIDLSTPDNAVVYQSERRGAAGAMDQIKEWVGVAVEYFR